MVRKGELSFVVIVEHEGGLQDIDVTNLWELEKPWGVATRRGLQIAHPLQRRRSR